MPLPWTVAARTARRAASSSTRSADGPLIRRLRRFLAALAVSAVLAQPAAAQDRTTLPELENLIPDSAVEHPEDWARQGVPPAAAPADNAQPQPDTPLAELPLITVPWPEQLQLPELAPLTPDPTIRFAEPETPLPGLREGEEVRVSSELLLVFPSAAAQFPDREAFVDRFKQLSTIEEYEDNDSVARLAAQARKDDDLLERMLRDFG
jgi:translocation and assembly module TamA